MSESESEDEDNRRNRLSELDGEQSVALYDIIRQERDWHRQYCADPPSPSSADLAYEAELLSWRRSESEALSSSSSSKSSKPYLSLALIFGSLFIVIVLWLEYKLVKVL